MLRKVIIMGGREGLRGYLVQTIICVLDAFNEDNEWNAVALEPNIESEKVDIVWYYSDPTKSIVDQVKSSKNQINIPQIKKWSKELEESIEADEYNLFLIGPVSIEVAKTEKQGNVILKKKTLDIDGLISEAAHKLGIYAESKNIEPIKSNYREIIIESLVTKYEILSTSGKILSKREFNDKIIEMIRPFLNTGTSIIKDSEFYAEIKDADEGVNIEIDDHVQFERVKASLKAENVKKATNVLIKQPLFIAFDKQCPFCDYIFNNVSTKFIKCPNCGRRIN